jgi:hypothetical protein
VLNLFDRIKFSKNITKIIKIIKLQLGFPLNHRCDRVYVALKIVVLKQLFFSLKKEKAQKKGKITYTFGTSVFAELIIGY